MPCCDYPPPPPWAEDARKSAEDAVKLLCGMVRAWLDAGVPVSQDVLIWFIGHRRIDYAIATSPRYAAPSPAEAESAKADIIRVAEMLGITDK